MTTTASLRRDLDQAKRALPAALGGTSPAVFLTFPDDPDLAEANGCLPLEEAHRLAAPNGVVVALRFC